MANQECNCTRSQTVPAHTISKTMASKQLFSLFLLAAVAYTANCQYITPATTTTCVSTPTLGTGIGCGGIYGAGFGIGGLGCGGFNNGFYGGGCGCGGLAEVTTCVSSPVVTGCGGCGGCGGLGYNGFRTFGGLGLGGCGFGYGCGGIC